MTSETTRRTERFDSLPGDALLSDKDVADIMGTSPATVWRHARKGILPKPLRFGTRCTRWRVGDLRAAFGASQ